MRKYRIEHMALLNPEQLASAKLLVQENMDLQNQLLELNRDLDDHLSRRGQVLSRVVPISRTSNSQYDKLLAKNEHQRKVNDELSRQLLIVDGLAKTDELKQRLQMLTAQADLLRNENKGLENVYGNQQIQTSLTGKIEAEMKRAKQDHHEEITKIKETIRQLKDARESESDQVRNLQRNEAKVELRLKIQNEPQGNITLAELELIGTARERELEKLKEQILDLSKMSTNKVRARAANDKRSREMDELRMEADLLREKLEALEIRDEL